MEKVWQFLKKLKTELSYDPGIPLLEMYLKNIKTLIWKKCIHFYVRCSISYNSQDMEIT